MNINNKLSLNIFIILFIILYYNIEIVWSINCPTGYPEGINGCHNGPNSITTSLCYQISNPSILIGTIGPCVDHGTIATNTAVISNNKFKWFSCQKQVVDTIYYYGLAGACDTGSLQVGSSALTMEFNNNTFRYFVLSTCKGPSTTQLIGEISDSNMATPTKTQEFCQNVALGIITFSNVFDFGQSECQLGYTNYPICSDINECELTPKGGCQQECQNTIGSFKCVCTTGYVLGSDKKSCVDIDECGNGSSGCSNTCINTIGSFTCGCPEGFRLGSDLKTCVDIDECNENSSGCSHGCLNNIPGYTCTCNQGYRLQPDNKTCLEIDECAENISGCEQLCSNTVGGFTCNCNSGYRLNENKLTCDEINECSEGSSGCSQKCTNTPSSFECSCNPGYYLSTLDFKTCLDVNECLSPPCPEFQVCVNSIGSYSCVSNYIDHVITSVIPSTTSGGPASFFGNYGDIRQKISLLIGDTNCNVTFDSSTLIICTALPGTGEHSVSLTQNGKSYYINNFYKYQVEIKKCKNDCTSPKQGTCNTITGSCECLAGYTSFDCSIKNTVDDENQPPKTNVTIGDDGETSLSNQQTNFQIYFKSLSEIGVNGQIIKSYQLKDKWTLDNKTTIESTIHTFTQLLNDNDDEIQNSNCQITSIIEQIKKDKEFTFAGNKFMVESGLIKFTIKISNYTYSSFLNTLKLDIISSVGELENSNDNDECNLKDTEIEEDIDESTTFNYIKISKNNKQLSGRFVNYLLSDGRPTYFTTQSTANKSDDSITISLFLPHFTQDVVIDPDFAVLVSNDYKSECSGSPRKWVIPVAVVVSVVGASTLVILGFIIYKKNNVSIKVGVAKLRRFN